MFSHAGHTYSSSEPNQQRSHTRYLPEKVPLKGEARSSETDIVRVCGRLQRKLAYLMVTSITTSIPSEQKRAVT